MTYVRRVVVYTHRVKHSELFSKVQSKVKQKLKNTLYTLFQARYRGKHSRHRCHSCHTPEYPRGIVHTLFCHCTLEELTVAPSVASPP